MVKQNVALQNADGSHRCWMAAKEIERLLKSRQVRRIVEKGKPVKYRLIAPPTPSSSHDSPCELRTWERERIAATGERELKRLLSNLREPKPEPRDFENLENVQRWMGRGYLAGSETVLPVLHQLAQI